MWKWRKRGLESKNILLPRPGKLLRTIQQYPFDQSDIMPVGSFPLFLFSEKVCTDSKWNQHKNVELWLFHFLVNGEQIHLRWYEEVPTPNSVDMSELTTVLFDWSNYWQYVYPE